MKKILLVIPFLLFLSCDKESISICGCDKPEEELQWLKELIQKADTDTTGNYIGTIFLEEYNDEYIFFTDMAMGSGGLMGYWFDCEGNRIYPEPAKTQIKKIIYSNTKLINH
jgi:hypothetical protein